MNRPRQYPPRTTETPDAHANGRGIPSLEQHEGNYPEIPDSSTDHIADGRKMVGNSSEIPNSSPPERPFRYTSPPCDFCKGQTLVASTKSLTPGPDKQQRRKRYLKCTKCGVSYVKVGPASVKYESPEETVYYTSEEEIAASQADSVNL